MVVVDTSVWVDYLRGKLSQKKVFDSLIDADEIALPIPVRLELLSGVKKGEVTKLRMSLNALTTLYPSSSTWEKAEELALLAARKGVHPGFADLLICSLAGSYPIWTYDNDIKQLEQFGWVRLFTI